MALAGINKQNVPPPLIEGYEKFCELTSERGLLRIRSGAQSLDEVVKLCAYKVATAIEMGNLIHYFPDLRKEVREKNPLAERAWTWEKEQKAELVKLLDLAIESKKDYYNSTCMGRITQLILKLLCLWDQGTTPTIKKALLTRAVESNPL